MIGRIIGHYRIVAHLGEGGMGVVYRAEDTKLGRSVALKLLPPELSRDPEAKSRFKREARAASLLDHPNICTIYDFGEADGGQMYIAMAYYDGESLATRISRHVTSLDEAIRIVEQVARGLGKAHSSGIVHRDIKPANVMITSDGVAKIVDFGLAKLSGSTGITRSHTSLGTIAYMAPEQIEAGEVGSQADIWALGVVFFELLTGKRPFRGDYTPALQYSILNEQPATITDLRPDLPPDLDRIIKRMLRKDALQRYQTMAEVLAELEPLETPSSGSGARRHAIRREKLRAGARLGPYQIEKPLGSGGMGDVYLAKDTRLDRQVAIKILPPEFSEDAQLKQRFQREAKTISQLSHPNICTLFDVGEQEGMDFLVMEYLEGETLSEKLTRGALPISQLLRYGRQIADALDRAHRQGIVHRDLKPGNVIITKNESVKLLDFGLAKENAAVLTSPVARNEKEAGPDERTVRRTVESERPLTAEGMIVGTLPYMAPEQIEGKQIDARTDIFALGTMLYEMVTGKRAFEGKTRASLIVAIIDRDPIPITTLQPGEWPVLVHLINKCLKKDPDSRWQSARDIATELQWIEEGGQAAIGQARSAAQPRVLRYTTLVLFLLSVALGSLAWWNYREAHRPRPNRKLSIELAADAPLAEGPINLFSISPDGRTLVYTGEKEGKLRLFRRRLDDDAVVPLPGTEGAEGPFFSPDGESVGFAAGGKLQRTQLSGGNPSVICDAPGVRGATWGTDGTIVFAAFESGRLMRVSASGGAPEPITAVRKGEHSHRYPQWLPDGDHVLFTVRSEAGEGHSLAVVSLRTRHITDVHSGAFSGQYEAGRLVYATPGGLFAVPFDAGKLRTVGKATPVSSEVLVNTYASLAHFVVSSDGSLIFQPRATISKESQLVVVNAKGIVTPFTKTLMNYGLPRISPDGQEIVIEDAGWGSGAVSDLWRCQIAAGSCSRLTSNGTSDGPIWSPDQTMLAFTCVGKGDKPTASHRNICVMRANGGDPLRILAPGSKWNRPTCNAWSKDGRFIVFQKQDQGGWDLWKWDLSKGDDEGAVSPLVRTAAGEGLASLSPDSRWLAYASNESGKWQVYVTTFPDAGRRWQVTADGGGYPVWGFDSRQLFYREDYRDDTKVMVVDVKTTPDLVFGQPRMLYRGEGLGLGPPAVMPDGKSLIGVRSLTKSAPVTHLSIEVNIMDRLPRK